MKKFIIIIWNHIKPSKRQVYFLAVVSLVSSLMAAIIPTIYGWLVDAALNNQGPTLIGLGLLTWLILSLTNHWFNRIVWRESEILASKAEVKFLKDYANYVLHLPFSYLKEQKIGKLVGSVDRASYQLDRVISQVIFNFLPNIFTILIILILLLFINWLLSLSLLIIIAVYVFITLKYSKHIAEADKKLHNAYRDSWGDYWEYLSNYETVKAFTAEDMVIGSINKRFKNIITQSRISVNHWSKMEFGQSTIFTFGFVGLFGLGILMLSDGRLTPGNLVSFVGYMAFIFGVMGRVAGNFSVFRRAMVDVSAASKVYQVKPEIERRHKNLQALEEIKGRVIFKDVSFRYQGKNQPVVLDNINFEVKPGEIIALVGGSGAGKSTLVDLIANYYLPTSGSVMIDGYSSRKIDGKALRQSIAVVPQEVSLFYDSIAFNIKFGKSGASQADIERVAQAANCHEFIMELPKKYNSKVGERGVKLSVGQKQRLAIARALMRDPKILILDEATSSLDSITEKVVQEALERLVKGRTTFIIAHRLSTVVNADRIFVLEKGKIIEMGKHLELLAMDGVYRRLYEAQKF